jgi:hypothetical protein
LVAENSTTPVGVVAVPVPVSVTFAVQVAVCPPTATIAGQLSDVEVERSRSAEAVPRLSSAAVPTTTARAITTRAPRPTMGERVRPPSDCDATGSASYRLPLLTTTSTFVP